MSRRYRHHKYTWEKPFGSVRHMWQLVGPRGGIHFTVSLYEKHDPSAGLEIHYSRESRPDRDAPPSQMPCWLIGEPCWHDGTSLYAIEHLWPLIEPMLRHSEHEAIFRVLENEANRVFGHTPEDDE